MTKIFGIDNMFSDRSQNRDCGDDLIAGDDGFLLIEALIALAICSLAVVALIRFSQVSANVQNRSSVKAQAILEARNLVESVGTEIKLVTGEQILELPSNRTATITIEPYEPSYIQSRQSSDQEFLYQVSVVIDTEQFGTVVLLRAVRAHDLY
ncbi:type IV pilus modification PilV family protein [Kordiimonas aquimaris]|uniref:type IV pilus modification PilV family protein n=1 Tax=Kordiimonas aquimaris TaxID=707591 RepID=UPI0021D347EB|nr:hypothetical protein [Kordiimonas aquimaris]